MNYNKGKNNPNYKEGLSLNDYYCLDCTDKISYQSALYGTHRCRSCSSIIKNARLKTKQKISKAKTGIKNSTAHNLAISLGLKGRIFSKKHRESISLSMKGKGLIVWDDLSYRNKHQRFTRTHGKASKCENRNCDYKNPKRYHWANISGKYLEDRSDWKELCVSCHRNYDLSRKKLNENKISF